MPVWLGPLLPHRASPQSLWAISKNFDDPVGETWEPTIRTAIVRSVDHWVADFISRKAFGWPGFSSLKCQGATHTLLLASHGASQESGPVVLWLLCLHTGTFENFGEMIRTDLKYYTSGVQFWTVYTLKCCYRRTIISLLFKTLGLILPFYSLPQLPNT